MRGLRYRSSPSIAPADLQPVRLLSYLTALNKGGHPWTKTQPPATGSSILPPAWSTSPTCCPQNSNVSRSRTWTPASTNGATTAADAPSATAGVTTTAPRHHAKAIRPRPSRPTCGSANSRTGFRTIAQPIFENAVHPETGQPRFERVPEQCMVWEQSATNESKSKAGPRFSPSARTITSAATFRTTRN